MSSDFDPIFVCNVGAGSGGEAGSKTFPADGPISMREFSTLGVTAIARNVKYWIRAGAKASDMQSITGINGDLNTGGNAFEFDIGSTTNIRNIRYDVPVPFVDILADFKVGGGDLMVYFHRRK